MIPTTLLSEMERSVTEVRRWPLKGVQLFHHNDTDGLCSGAILSRAFEREGFEVSRFCLEKPYPAVLEKIFAQEGRLLVFADFAGRIAPLLSKLNRGRNLTLILDHHVAEAATDPMVHNLDPDLFGLRGDRDISASTTCYLFARTLDRANTDMAHIAALGAVGDGFFVDGRLVSLNREVALDAAALGTFTIDQDGAAERYSLVTPRGPYPCVEASPYLDVLGGAGYYRDGPAMGGEGVSRRCVLRIGPHGGGVAAGAGPGLRRRNGPAQERWAEDVPPHPVVSRGRSFLAHGSEDHRSFL